MAGIWVDAGFGRTVDRWKLLAGRRADPRRFDEAAAGFKFSPPVPRAGRRVGAAAVHYCCEDRDIGACRSSSLGCLIGLRDEHLCSNQRTGPRPSGLRPRRGARNSRSRSCSACADNAMNPMPRWRLPPGIRDIAYLTAKLNRVRAGDRGEFQQHGSLDWFVRFEAIRLHGHARAHDIDDTAVLPPFPAVESISARPVRHWPRDRDACS